VKNLDIKTSLAEIQQKSLTEIQRETAEKWCARSLAAYMLFHEHGDTTWYLDAEEYRHEALEHAALIEDDGATFREVMSVVNKARAEAMGKMTPLLKAAMALDEALSLLEISGR
jgi:hypothetical protein